MLGFENDIINFEVFFLQRAMEINGQIKTVLQGYEFHLRFSQFASPSVSLIYKITLFLLNSIKTEVTRRYSWRWRFQTNLPGLQVFNVNQLCEETRLPNSGEDHFD